jgi:hypothetical protein
MDVLGTLPKLQEKVARGGAWEQPLPKLAQAKDEPASLGFFALQKHMAAILIQPIAKRTSGVKID